MACLLTVGAAICPLGVGQAFAHPIANFDWAPKPVVAGTAVTFESESIPQDEVTPIATFAWDLDGKASCVPSATASSSTCTATAPAAGEWRVTLRVVDIVGQETSVTKAVPVQAPPRANQPPTAAFAALPASPLVGEDVTFVSYSQDRDGTIVGQAWDLDGDGVFDDASGPVATRSFAAPGPKAVALRVTDEAGAASTMSVTITVRNQNAGGAAGNPPTMSQPGGSIPQPKLLSPFPIVRLAGSVAGGGTSIDVLAVRAPRGSRVLVRCRGDRCPLKRLVKVVRRSPLRLKAAERVWPAGVALDVLVRRGNRIGKFTHFRFRANRRPRRADGCVWPGTAQMAPCPGA